MLRKKGNTAALRPIDAPHFRYWQAFYHAFFNPKLYVDVGKRWKGLSILYLFLLLLIATLPMFFVVVKAYNASFQQNIAQPLAQLPRLYIQNGNVTANVAMPYFIKNKLGAVSIIVDNTGKYKEFDKQYPRLSLLITQDKIMFRLPALPFNISGNVYQLPAGETVSHTLPKNLNQVFDAKEWITSSKIRTTQIAIDLILYPSIVMAVFGVYLVLLFALGLMAQFVAKILIKIDLTYLQSFRLLMVAATPQIFVTLFLGALGWTFSGFAILSVVLFAVYFSLAAIAMKNASHKMVLQ